MAISKGKLKTELCVLVDYFYYPKYFIYVARVYFFDGKQFLS